jgi:hypothetical protein
VHASMDLAVSLSPTGDWTQAAAIMTFAIPVALFVIVATVLYFQYTRPHVTPGHRDLAFAAAGAGAGASVGPAPAAPAARAGEAAEEGPATGDTTEGTE